MKSLREKQMAELIKDALIGVQKATPVYEQLSSWEKKALLMNEKEIDEAANEVAAKVEKYVVSGEKTGNKPPPPEVQNRLFEELVNYSK